MKKIHFLIVFLFVYLGVCCPVIANANPSTCPLYPVPEDMSWYPHGQPSGQLFAVMYLKNTQGVYCYYRNTSGLITGFLSSKFTVTGIVGTDWIRIYPCPLDKSCYRCTVTTESSCHFHS